MLKKNVGTKYPVWTRHEQYDEISKKLGKEYQVGYSYFMSNIDHEKIRKILDYAIIPLIEQYFFGKKESVDVIKNICINHLRRMQNAKEGEEESNSKGTVEQISLQSP